MTEIFVKNMVCPRCVMAVEEILAKMDIGFERVELGKAVIYEPLSPDKMLELEGRLRSMGFEILKDKDVQKIERIKILLQEKLQHDKINDDFNLSDMIKSDLAEDYSRLSNMFSSLEGMTIEKYFINLKIEKVKELLFYQELTLSEMAWELGYSSVQHLSTQFKKVTGMTPSEYKKLKHKPRKGLDEV
ncbi:helix-turn-helix transcriptional regulator [Litoribacter ruber]|uniref:helix-turn-helix domain-containing protein n=1 Tax=Litoribacter ruber TaxID=702568 RepID=UPI001BD959EC|nr:AraC family transcriptional regulator [Litoribacter ruber]MBT0809916.1 helix-turn-helix transcriptional regulator [Litoribacter ruber]